MLPIHISLIPKQYSLSKTSQKKNPTSQITHTQTELLVMEDYRSKSCRDGGMMQIERYNNGGRKNEYEGPTSMNDLRSYSTSHASTTVHPSSSNNNIGGKVGIKMKKEKNNGGKVGRSWSLNDPEIQRKKRVASYKVYSAEGKMKGSFKKSFRWIKDTYTHVVYGWR